MHFSLFARRADKRPIYSTHLSDPDTISPVFLWRSFPGISGFPPYQADHMSSGYQSFPDHGLPYRSSHNRVPVHDGSAPVLPDCQAFVNSFDLIDTNSFVLCKNTVSSSLYTQDQIFIFTFFFERNFCLIGAAHLFLDLSVKAASLVAWLLCLLPFRSCLSDHRFSK